MSESKVLGTFSSSTRPPPTSPPTFPSPTRTGTPRPLPRPAAEGWRDSTLSQRTNVLFTLRQLLVEHADEMAALITQEHGKTLADAKGELARGLQGLA